MPVMQPSDRKSDPDRQTPPAPDAGADEAREAPAPPAKEIGGRGGLDPTRYGDWEKNGRCIDF